MAKCESSPFGLLSKCLRSCSGMNEMIRLNTAKTSNTFSFVLLLGVLSLSTTSVNADVERAIDFRYDAAGNIIQKITQEQDTAPTPPTFIPNFINKGQSVVVTATGSNFLNATVTTAVQGLSISEILSSANQITFRLSASTSAPIGGATINIITTLGTSSEVIHVAEEAPVISTIPQLVAVSKNTSTDIVVHFSLPRQENESYIINTGDNNILTAPATLNVQAGQTEALLTLTGVADGVSDLNISLPSKFYFYSFPVFVGKSFAEMLIDFPDMKQRNIFSDLVNAYVTPTGEFPVNAVFSNTIGASVNSIPTLFSNTVGVQVGIPRNFSKDIEVLVGPMVVAVQPLSVTRGGTATLQITGFNLNEVQNIATTPGTFVMVGAHNVNAENTLLTVPLTIDQAAAVGQYTLTLTGANGTIKTRAGTQLTFDIQ